MGFLQWEIQVAFPRESQLQQNCTTQLNVHAGCFNVSTIHQTLTWTNGIFNVCTDLYVCDCTWGCTDAIRESALKIDSGRKIPCLTGESNLRQQRDGPMLYQLSYIPIFMSDNDQSALE